MQKTLKREVFISGVGLFTGEKVSIRIRPAPAGHGIVFQRIDLPNKPVIAAQIENVSDILRCTRLKTADASVITVEHLLSAFSAYEIDNLHIDVEGPEIPAGDGSSQPFVELIEGAGIAEQDAPKKIKTLSQPVYWTEKEIHLIALPSLERRVSYTLHYPQSALLRSQFFSLLINPDSYKAEIAPCRTFSLYEEIAPLIEKGLIKGGGLENAVVIRGEKILNPGGIRFPDEMVRHKILDLIGDLSLLGNGLRAHIIAIRSGHASNIAFAKTLHNFFERECHG
ncbi:MAG: UDP-3-O-acyl-N-acetylglucosamine deacetylase [Parachlamydiales bacterium]|nr:UDP-3-O-acyl-N-acetylglucosamine deacetylase [Parachlamydiales bacterium]